MNIVLIGFMGSGKSRVGRLLADRLKWTFVDTDDIIVKEAGKSIADIINTKGEPFFRELERNVVARVAGMKSCVISTGGGVPMDPANLNALAASGGIVWLKVSPEVALNRAGDFSTRPLIDASNPLESIRLRMAQRELSYSSAKYSVDTDKGNINATVNQVLSFFPQLPVS